MVSVDLFVIKIFRFCGHMSVYSCFVCVLGAPYGAPNTRTKCFNVHMLCISWSNKRFSESKCTVQQWKLDLEILMNPQYWFLQTSEITMKDIWQWSRIPPTGFYVRDFFTCDRVQNLPFAYARCHSAILCKTAAT